MLRLRERGDFDFRDVAGSAGRALEIYDQGVTRVVDGGVEETRTRLLRTYVDWIVYAGNERSGVEDLVGLPGVKDLSGLPEARRVEGKFAFMVHPRDMEREIGSDPFGDIPRQFPALDQSRGVDFGQIVDVFRHLPGGFWLSDYRAPEGEEVLGMMFSVGFTLNDLIRRGLLPGEDGKRSGSRLKALKYARERIKQSVQLTKGMGVQVVGLGEIMAAVTRHGIWLQKEFPEGPLILTGHRMTTAMIEEVMVESVRKAGGLDSREMALNKLKEESVTIIGGAGSIGRATAVWLADKVKRIVLEDLKGSGKGMEKIRESLLEINPGLEVEIIEAEKGKKGKEQLRKACQMSRLLVGAAAVAKPLIRETGMLQKGSIFVDDSQPPMVDEKVANSEEVLVVWPISSAVARRDFGTGLALDSEGQEGFWSCEKEVATVAKALKQGVVTMDWLLKEAKEKNSLVGGPVTPKGVKWIRALAEKMGTMRTAPLQAYGRLIPEKKIEALAEHWKS